MLQRWRLVPPRPSRACWAVLCFGAACRSAVVVCDVADTAGKSQTSESSTSSGEVPCSEIDPIDVKKCRENGCHDTHAADVHVTDDGFWVDDVAWPIACEPQDCEWVGEVFLCDDEDSNRMVRVIEDCVPSEGWHRCTPP